MSAPCILVVDDNPTNLKLVADLLGFEGYRVIKAEDAERAIIVIEESPPDLILMDIGLPGMDGLTLTRRLKSDPRTAHIQIVALTAFAMKADEQRAREAGCDGYITKPIDTRTFAAQIGDHIARPKFDLVLDSMKILVIEDQPSELKLAHHVLSSAGHDVTGADAAEQAFAAIEENRPQIILLDLSLPGMDGLALARRLKAEPATSNIQIVAVTSYPERFTRDEAIAAGCDAYIVKPINTRTLPQDLIDVVVRGTGQDRSS